MDKEASLKQLMQMPGVGRSIATDLWKIGVTSIADLRRQDPELLYELSNRQAGVIQDRCLLYVFRCAVYYAETEQKSQDPDKLKWWNWKDATLHKPRQKKKTKIA